MKALAFAVVLAALVLSSVAHAQAADWQAKGAAAWGTRTDVNVLVTLRAGSPTGPALVSPTQMIGVKANELRDVVIPTTVGAGSGQKVCATAYAYVGSDPNVPRAADGSNRSTEVAAANCKSFQLDPWVWQ